MTFTLTVCGGEQHLGGTVFTYPEAEANIRIISQSSSIMPASSELPTSTLIGHPGSVYQERTGVAVGTRNNQHPFSLSGLGQQRHILHSSPRLSGVGRRSALQHLHSGTQRKGTASIWNVTCLRRKGQQGKLHTGSSPSNQKCHIPSSHILPAREGHIAKLGASVGREENLPQRGTPSIHEPPRLPHPSLMRGGPVLPLCQNRK